MSNKPATKAKEPTVSKTLDQRIAEARAALASALTDGRPAATFREFVRELEAEQQRLANEQAAAEAAKRAAAQQMEAEREAGIRAASKTLLEARNARLDMVRNHLKVRAIPDTRSSFI